MDKTRMIINEIHYWKEHRLLPERYCDYLIALYTKGGEIEQTSSNKKEKKKVLTFVYFGILLVMLAVVSFLFSFYNYPVNLQLSLLLLGVFLSGCGIVFYQTKSRWISFVGWMTLLLFILQLSVLFINLIFANWLVNVILLVNFAIWIFLGYFQKDNILKMIGIIAFISMIIYVVFLNF